MQAHTPNLLEIISPVGTDGLLPPHIPDVELIALVLQRFNVEAERGLDGVDVIPVKLLHDGCLAGVVEPPVDGKKKRESSAVLNHVL